MFIHLTHFRELGQKCRNIFVWFLVQMKTLNFAFEIKWPLMRKKNQNANEESRKKACLAEKAEVLDEFFCTGKVLESSKTIKKFSSYFFLCLFLVFFSATDFSSAFQFQTQNIIFCSSDPEFWRSDKMHNEAWNFEFISQHRFE